MSSIKFEKTTMRAMAMTALCLALVSASGCATSWAINGGKPFEEKVRKEIVPEGSVDETLHITLFPAGAPIAAGTAQASTAQASTAQPRGGTVATHTTLRNIPSLQCRLSQSGDETEHRSYRLYGSTWKKTAALAFVAEAALAAAYLLKSDPEVADTAFGAYMAADALGTGVLAFFPRRDRFRSTRSRESLDIHQLCPPGLNIEVAGRRISVDRNGKLEDNADEYLREHFERSLGPVAVHINLGQRGQFQSQLELNKGVTCGWARSTSHPDVNRFCQPPPPGTAQIPAPTKTIDRVTTMLFVTPGTLSQPRPVP
ncbi:MAG: hypothetical protein GY811_24570 [Myxococcales bacterium]|nr:hypothetical protein [Myxococcales bacterium]